MKANYPAEAFALAIIIFSRNMKEALVTGILVIVMGIAAVLFCEIGKKIIPKWSRDISTILLSCTISAAAFELTYFVLELEFSLVLLLVAIFIGFFCATHAIDGEVDYGTLLWEGAICWSGLIFLGIIRESLVVGESTFSSPAFEGIIFGFLAAGIGIAFTNGLLKINIGKSNSIWILVLLLFLYPPMTLSVLPKIAAVFIGLAVGIICFLSIQKRITFSDTGRAFQNLPIEMLSIGFLYMILSVF